VERDGSRAEQGGFALLVQRFSPVRLKQRREASGLTRTELAYAVGRSEQMVFLWEKGKFVPPTEVLVRIAQALGVDVGDLFEDGSDG
jgi:DNA-binding XRE family transcriptional regulator